MRTFKLFLRVVMPGEAGLKEVGADLFDASNEMLGFYNVLERDPATGKVIKSKLVFATTVANVIGFWEV